jgi:hypothetical protein
MQILAIFQQPLEPVAKVEPLLQLQWIPGFPVSRQRKRQPTGGAI